MYQSLRYGILQFTQESLRINSRNLFSINTIRRNHQFIIPKSNERVRPVINPNIYPQNQPISSPLLSKKKLNIKEADIQIFKATSSNPAEDSQWAEPYMGSKNRFLPLTLNNLRDIGNPKSSHRSRRGSRLRSFIRNIKKYPVESKLEPPRYTRLPVWGEAVNSQLKMKKEPIWISLQDIELAIRRGQLDARFPITQRHLYFIRLCEFPEYGISVYNEDELPFPFKIVLEVSGADQNTINAISAVGGTLRVIYFGHAALIAHLDPERFQILPTAQVPPPSVVLELEKARARGAEVQYLQPSWLIREQAQLREELSLKESAENLSNNHN